ncbi:conserved hypothetical protein [Leishmania infantum JPCM5]|uniref:Uncharacterized protein n=2 Tax=Leishmania infantum TaxID=5671 RepID=A4ID09_LEIIN|nr:conserved hypothetical protein [Leishmania infantum JPCM5]CAC9551488.1 hypothetical_protein_-_conserved [Leishmania infantum]CAM72738.1 conserved hypothetical protein [Leishmania infantum JPCM5]SUZ46785.1 hypothetical_protein_-_conserved [Leishmania infantum]|eukprot:XP_001469628.1 conserved hypothetical protein [Leishmania infantum JPCM5]
MGRPSLMERYFAQCQAHRTSPHPAFVAGLREGAMDINFAEIPLADIRLFAHALLDVSPAARAARSPAARSRNSSGQLSRRDAASDTSPSSRPRTSAFSRTQFAKLHFSYNATVPAAQLPCGAASPPASTPWFTQNEPTLRRLPQAVAQAVKESATTLSSFSWCGMPLTSMAVQGRAPLQQQRGIGRVLPSLTRVLPLCHCLTSLRLDGVPLSHAQFMQLTTPFPKSPEASADGGVTWPALEEASFVGCGLTDACKNGLVHLIRAAVPTASDSTWQRSLRGGYANLDDRLLPRPAGGTVPLGHSATRGLKGLDASQNPLGDETAHAVANAVPGSALRYLNMSSTSITWMGGSLLASRPVLEGTAMELLDMSNTGVSEVFSHAGGAAEAKMLVESSAAAGFRVLARGMGQLLILRESDRSPQQSWLIQTTTAIAPQPSPASAPEPPHVESPTIPTCPPASVIEMERVAPPAPPAPPLPSSNTGDQHSAPQSVHNSAAAPGPAVSPYGPWWPMFASWYAARDTNIPTSSADAAATGSSAAGLVKGYIPVPVPFPMLAPMPIPYTAPHGEDLPFAGAATVAAAAATSPHETGAVAEDSTPFPERRVSTPPADDPIDVAAETSVPLPSPTSSGEKHDKDGGGSFTGGLSNPPDAASTASQAAAVAASASDDLVHRASETAGDRKFLLALISRLEAHESDVTERLEAQYQRTTAQLTSLEKDMRFRLQQLADADRKERAAAADRQTALLEALAALRAEPVAVSAEGMTETMLLQLMHLIEAGMGKVQTALGAEGAVGTKSARAGESRVSPLLRSNEAATHVGAATITDRDLVKTASQRLKELGW